MGSQAQMASLQKQLESTKVKLAEANEAAAKKKEEEAAATAAMRAELCQANKIHSEAVETLTKGAAAATKELHDAQEALRQKDMTIQLKDEEIQRKEEEIASARGAIIQRNDREWWRTRFSAPFGISLTLSASSN